MLPELAPAKDCLQWCVLTGHGCCCGSCRVPQGTNIHLPPASVPKLWRCAPLQAQDCVVYFGTAAVAVVGILSLIVDGFEAQGWCIASSRTSTPLLGVMPCLVMGCGNHAYARAFCSDAAFLVSPCPTAALSASLHWVSCTAPEVYTWSTMPLAGSATAVLPPTPPFPVP